MKNLKPFLGLVLIIGLCSFTSAPAEMSEVSTTVEAFTCTTVSPYGTEVEPARISTPTIVTGDFGCLYSIEFSTFGACAPYTWTVSGDYWSYTVTNSGSSSSILIYPDGDNLTGGTIYLELDNNCGGYVGRKIDFCCVS